MTSPLTLKALCTEAHSLFKHVQELQTTPYSLYSQLLAIPVRHPSQLIHWDWVHCCQQPSDGLLDADLQQSREHA